MCLKLDKGLFNQICLTANSIAEGRHNRDWWVIMKVHNGSSLLFLFLTCYFCDQQRL